MMVGIIPTNINNIPKSYQVLGTALKSLIYSQCVTRYSAKELVSTPDLLQNKEISDYSRTDYWQSKESGGREILREINEEGETAVCTLNSDAMACLANFALLLD